MPYPYKANYEQEGITLLREAHRGQPRTEALVRAQLRGVQRLEDALQGLGSPYDIDGALGDQLDQIAAIFGLDRNGLPDASFRLFIRGRIAAAKGNGLLSDIEEAAAALFQASRVYTYAPTSAGAGPQARGGGVGVMVASPSLPAELYPLAKKLLVGCLPAGVSLLFLGTFDASQAMAFDAPQPYVAGLDSGLLAGLS